MFKLWLHKNFQSIEQQEQSSEEEQITSQQKWSRLYQLFPSVKAEDNTVEEKVEKKSGIIHYLMNVPTLPHFNEDPDDLYQQYKDRIMFLPVGETGWERVKNLWKGLLNGTAPEHEYVMETVCIGGTVGALWGVIFKSRGTKQRLVNQFNDMAFEGEYHARKKMVNLMYLEASKNAWQLAWRFAAFPFVLSCLVFTSFAYRDYVNPLDFAACGFVTGALWKFKLGPRASLVGGVTSSIIALLGGCMMWTTFKLSGTTVQEWRYWKGCSIASQIKRKKAREDAIVRDRLHDTDIDKSFDQFTDAQETKKVQMIESHKQEKKKSESSSSPIEDIKKTTDYLDVKNSVKSVLNEESKSK